MSDDFKHWAKKIKTAWARSIESIVETGRLLKEAKSALPHGQWIKMVESELPFGLDTAERLMAVASHPVLSDKEFFEFLPRSVDALRRLAAFDEAELRAMIADGLVNSAMSEDDVRALRQEARGLSQPSSVQVEIEHEPQNGGSFARSISVSSLRPPGYEIPQISVQSAQAADVKPRELIDAVIEDLARHLKRMDRKKRAEKIAYLMRLIDDDGGDQQGLPN